MKSIAFFWDPSTESIRKANLIEFIQALPDSFIWICEFPLFLRGKHCNYTLQPVWYLNAWTSSYPETSLSISSRKSGSSFDLWFWWNYYNWLRMRVNRYDSIFMSVKRFWHVLNTMFSYAREHWWSPTDQDQFRLSLAFQPRHTMWLIRLSQQWSVV
jgi:hypothetical protein